jgi:hypothetical protein
VARYEGNHKPAVRVAELLYGETMARVYRTTADDEAEAVTTSVATPTRNMAR